MLFRSNINFDTIKLYYPFDSYKSWERCFDGCLYCSELGTSIYDTKCNLRYGKICSEGFYQVEDTTNCFRKTFRYNYYYFHEDSKKFKRCDISCLQCDKAGTDILNTNCLSSKCDELNNYYPLEDRPTTCYKYDISTTFPEQYYFDLNKKKFRRCQKGCLNCVEQIDANIDDT